MTKGWKILLWSTGILLLLAGAFVWCFLSLLPNLMPPSLSESLSPTRAGRVVSIIDSPFTDSSTECFAVLNSAAKPVWFGSFDSDESLIQSETWSKDGTLFAIRSEIFRNDIVGIYGPFFTTAYDFKNRRAYDDGPVHIRSKQIKELMLARGGELPEKSTKWRDLSSDQRQLYNR